MIRKSKLRPKRNRVYSLESFGLFWEYYKWYMTREIWEYGDAWEGKFKNPIIAVSYGIFAGIPWAINLATLD